MAKICIYGVGAIGGFLAVRLAQSGQVVTGIARGEQLAAIRARGLTLIQAGERLTPALECVAQPADLGPQDFVFLTMKSHTAAAISEDIAPLLGRDTVVVTAYNGFPWWYFHAANIRGDAPVLDSVDPGGRLWQGIGPERALGSVVYPAARVAEPAVIEHVFGNRFSIGEPDGSISARVQQLAQIMTRAGFDTAAIPNIRTEIWVKLVANAAFNPVSLLTGQTLAEMLDDAETYARLENIMSEAAAVAAALEIKLPVRPTELLELVRPFGAHKTSMLQDFEAGREIELDPIVGSITELARIYDVATPALDDVLIAARERVQA
jgi:2-dehydropantoate 2-reductase